MVVPLPTTAAEAEAMEVPTPPHASVLQTAVVHAVYPLRLGCMALIGRWIIVGRRSGRVWRPWWIWRPWWLWRP